jgi:E3 ubiquitin-protein ligase ATL23
MAQVWALSLAVASLAVGMLGVLGVWLCYLFQAVARPAPPPPLPPEEEEEVVDDKNGLSEAELRQLGGVCVPESAGVKEEDETLCPICLDAMEPGRPVRVLPGCNRAFHKDCVDRWPTISPRCPVCNVWTVPPPPATSPPSPKTA